VTKKNLKNRNFYRVGEREKTEKLLQSLIEIEEASQLNLLDRYV